VYFKAYNGFEFHNDKLILVIIEKKTIWWGRSPPGVQLPPHPSQKRKPGGGGDLHPYPLQGVPGLAFNARFMLH
jgi:hypothetical protein